MNKKRDKQIIKQNNSVESNEYKKLITIIIIVASIFLLFYILTTVFTKDKKVDIFKNDLNSSEIQYDEIIIGNMFDKSGEYYVLMLEKNDQYKELFENYVIKIRNTGSTIYTVDLNNAFNKKYVSDEYSYDKDDFKTKGTLLVRINDEEIKDYYESKEEILRKLENLSKSAE